VRDPALATPADVTCSKKEFEVHHTGAGVVKILVVPSVSCTVALNCADCPGATDAGPLISALEAFDAEGLVGLRVWGSPHVTIQTDSAATTSERRTSERLPMLAPCTD
jgi:hypothetical protein